MTSPYSIYGLSKPGVYVELVHLFCQLTKIHCRFGRENNSSYEQYQNGYWHGMVNHIRNEKYDISYPLFGPTKEVFEIVDFSEPIGEDQVFFVTRRPALSISLSHILQSIIF